MRRSLPRTVVGLVSDGSDAVAQCGSAWADGRLGRSGAPSLAACVDGRGSLVVVPGSDGACDMLGWSPSLGTDDRQRVAAMVTGRVSAELMAACRSDADDAVALVQSVLDDVGADEWSVVAPRAGVETGESCFAPLFDGATSTITLAAIPRPGN